MRLYWLSLFLVGNYLQYTTAPLLQFKNTFLFFFIVASFFLSTFIIFSLLSFFSITNTQHYYKQSVDFVQNHYYFIANLNHLLSKRDNDFLLLFFFLYLKMSAHNRHWSRLYRHNGTP